MKQDFSAMGRKGARKSAITRKRLRRLVTRKQRSQMKNLMRPDLLNWQIGDLLSLFDGLMGGK